MHNVWQWTLDVLIEKIHFCRVTNPIIHKCWGNAIIYYSVIFNICKATNSYAKDTPKHLAVAGVDFKLSHPTATSNNVSE